MDRQKNRTQKDSFSVKIAEYFKLGSFPYSISLLEIHSDPVTEFSFGPQKICIAATLSAIAWTCVIARASSANTVCILL